MRAIEAAIDSAPCVKTAVHAHQKRPTAAIEPSRRSPPADTESASETPLTAFLSRCFWAAQPPDTAL